MIELHGNIATYKCFDYGHPAKLDNNPSAMVPPHCQLCGSLLRPDVVWFGEELPAKAYELAKHVSFNSDVFISIGSSLDVYPAASLPLNASRCGAYLLQINPKTTMIDEFANCKRLDAACSFCF